VRPGTYQLKIKGVEGEKSRIVLRGEGGNITDTIVLKTKTNREESHNTHGWRKNKKEGSLENKEGRHQPKRKEQRLRGNIHKKK